MPTISLGGRKADSASRRVLPKRKRKVTSYYPTDSEPSDIEADEDEAEDHEAEDHDSEAESARPSKKSKVTVTAGPRKALAKKNIFPFTSLPAELKNKIYAYALTCNHDIPIIWKLRQYRQVAALGDTDSFQKFLRRGRYGYDPPYGPQKQILKPSLGPNLLVLNRQIHAQGLSFLYGANVFAFEDTRALYAFCANIGPKNCALLQQMVVKHLGYTKGSKSMNNPAFAMLASAVNLTRLKMDCAVHYSGYGAQVARQFYRDSHYWLEAVGCSKGRRDAAVDVVELGMQNVGRYHWPKEPREEQMAEVTTSFRRELRKLLHA